MTKSKLIMVNLVILLVLVISLLCSCCVKKIDIVNASIKNTDEMGMNIIIETDENLSNYDNSFYAYTVHLDYDIINIDEVACINLTKYNNKYNWPYIAERSSSYLDNNPLFTNWIIKLKRKSITTEANGYDLNKNGEYLLIFRISGGTMIGTSIKSNIIMLRL